MQHKQRIDVSDSLVIGFIFGAAFSLVTIILTNFFYSTGC